MSIKIRFVLLCCIRIIEWSVRGHVLVNFPSTHETLQHMENRLNTIVSHVAIDILTTRQLPALFCWERLYIGWPMDCMSTAVGNTTICQTTIV